MHRVLGRCDIGRALGQVGGHLQGQLGMLIAHRPVLQGMGAFGHQQMGHMANLCGMGRAGVFCALQTTQYPFMFNGRQGQGARADIAPRHQLGLGHQQ